MTGKSWPRELKVTGHITFKARKRRKLNTSALTDFSLFFLHSQPQDGGAMQSIALSPGKTEK